MFVDQPQFPQVVALFNKVEKEVAEIKFLIRQIASGNAEQARSAPTAADAKASDERYDQYLIEAMGWEGCPNQPVSTEDGQG